MGKQARLIFADPGLAGTLGDPSTAALRVERTVRRGSMDHVRLLQYHGDLPVHRGGYTVSLKRRPGPGGREVREVVAMLGHFFDGLDATFDPAPSLSRAGALEAAIAGAAPGVEPTDAPTWRLLVYPLHGAFHLAWEVRFSTDEPLGRWQAFVDARDGSVLEVQNRLMHDGLVLGNVWPENELRSPTRDVLPLRDAYVDLGTQVVVTDDRGVFPDFGQTTITTELAGPWVDMVNEDVPDASYTGSPDVLWDYPTSDTHFDEVNVFHHLNQFHAWVKGFLGFGGADRQLPAWVHYGSGFNNAFYDPAVIEIAFGDGDGFNYRSFAQDDVIYHEYGHFMFDMAISMGYGFNEVGGMQEGSADFFAGAFSGDSEIGEATVPGGNIRDLDNKGFFPPRIYPDYLQLNGFSPHAGGEVWGGALWDIRKVIGGAEMDPIAWDAFFFYPPDTLFIDGRAALIQADIDRHLGEHVRTIQQLMFERGIGPPPPNEPFVRILADPPTGFEPLPVRFTGIAADDGTITDLTWDLGDGTVLPGAGQFVTHTYPTAGTYDVTLTATDDTALTASYTIQVEVLASGTLVSCPGERDIGYVSSDRPGSNFFGDDDVYAGSFAGTDYHGAALFPIPVIPGGTGDLVFDSATVVFTGQDDALKGPNGGLWTIKLLEADVDDGWRQKGYTDIVSALPIYTLDPALRNGDLVPGGANTFTVTSAQLPSLNDRILTGSLAFRIDGPFGTSNLFSWDSGYDLFDEDPTAVRVCPVLTLSFTQNRLPGDVNADGVVDSIDARLVAEHAVGKITLDSGDASAGDVDRNGEVDERDAAAILQFEAGIIQL